MERSERKLKVACIFISFLIIFFSFVLFYQITHPYSIEITSSDQKTETKKEASTFAAFFQKEKTEKEENILILGRPGENHIGEDLTDTIILAHFAPQNKKVVLISIPRDLLVSSADKGYSLKINSIYRLFSIEELKLKIEEITGLATDHHVIVDIKVVQEIIDAVDGLNVFVPHDINDPYFPASNYTYQTFKLKKGWRYLDGETAVRYIRTRYTSPQGDFDRMARQQQIINLLKRKVLSLNPLWDFPVYFKIFQELRSHIETDISIWEIRDYWQRAKELDPDRIVNLVIDKKETKLLRGDLIKLGGQKASVIYPTAGRDNYQEIKEYINNFIQL